MDSYFKNCWEEKYKHTTFAARPKTMAEAITLALELEKSYKSDKNTLYIRNKINQNRNQNNIFCKRNQNSYKSNNF